MRVQPASPTADQAASLSEADQAYMQWLAGFHGTLDETGRGLIEHWQAVEEEGN